MKVGVSLFLRDRFVETNDDEAAVKPIGTVCVILGDVVARKQQAGIPKPWEIYSDTYTADQVCEKYGRLTPISDIKCIKAVSLIPGEKLSDFGSNTEYFRANVGLYRGKQSPKEVIEELTGLYSDGMTDSDAKINGQPAYYRRVSNESYTDVNYVIKSNAADEFVIVTARVASTHYTPGGAADDEKDFTRFEPGIKAIAQSVKF